MTTSYEKMLLSCDADHANKNAAVALDIYAKIAEANKTAGRRWPAWELWHNNMGKRLSAETLANFQADEIIAPQIVGGGGEPYIEKLRDLWGRDFRTFLNTFAESRVGNPRDLANVDGVPITRGSMRHLYHFGVIKKQAAMFDLSSVNYIEVGGGYGNLARIFSWYGTANRYHIVDFPPNIAIIHYFLSCHGLAAEIGVVAGNRQIWGDASARIVLVVADSLDYLATLDNTFLLSTMAMTEIHDEGKWIYVDNNDHSFVYIYGQNTLSGGPNGASIEHFGLDAEIDNRAFFHALAQRFMPIDCWENGYYTSFFGKSYGPMQRK